MGDFENKKEDWLRGLLLIEEKHIEFFKERKSRRSIQPHDRLTNHIIPNTTGTLFGINFTNEGLSENIKKEVEELFKKIWL